MMSSCSKRRDRRWSSSETRTRVCTATQGALAGEHPGRVPNPVVKVHDLAWLEFEKPDLERAELFARAFGFTTVSRTAHELQLRGTDAGAPCVLIRKGTRSRFVGTAFRAADPSDVLRLADATGRKVARAAGERGRGRRGPGRSERGHRCGSSPTRTSCPRCPARSRCRWNVGHAAARTNATQRPPRAPALVQRLGHVVLQSNRYVRDAGLVPAPPRPDRQRLPLLRAASASAGR